MLRALMRNHGFNFKVQSSPIRTTKISSFNLQTFSQQVSNASSSSSSSSSPEPPDPPTKISPDLTTHHDQEYIHFLLKGKLHSISNEQQEKRSGENHPYWTDPGKNSIYLPEDLAVQQTHHEPKIPSDKTALRCMGTVRSVMNMLAKYKGPDQMSKDQWLDRVIFLETLAGCHGMVASMVRHLRSLRTMTRDYGWISALLEESENERVHLLMLLEMKKPSFFYRTKLGLGQALFLHAFFISYFISPISAHRFVGYFHEEAVDTYTKLLSDLKDGKLSEWGKEPPTEVGKIYYKLKDGATIYDMFECIRADEANHRDVNHGFASDPIIEPESILTDK